MEPAAEQEKQHEEVTHIDAPPVEQHVHGILFLRGHATAEEIHRMLPEPVNHSVCRSLLRAMAAMGEIRERREMDRVMYLPAG